MIPTSSVIAEKYANLLTVEDVVRLFEKLETIVGNKVDAAKICGLERKTIYGWKTTKEIRLRTKKKLLAALIENLTEETLDFIAERSFEASVDVLRTYLTAIYEKAMDDRINAVDFMRLASKFDDIKKKYAGLIVDSIEVEVGNMSQFMVEKASELEVAFKPSSFNLLKLSEISIFLPSLIRTVANIGAYTSPVEIANFFNLPPEFVQALSKALNESYIRTRMSHISVQTVLPPESSYLTASTMEFRAPEAQGMRREEFPLIVPIPGGTT